MKLFKNIMSRKPDPEEIAALEAEAAEAREVEERTRRATTDDSGAKNASLKGADDLYPGALPPEPDTGSEGWSSSAWSDEDDDEDWDDEDWADEWDDDAEAGADTSVDAAKAALVEGLRDAARDIQGTSRRDGIRNWSEDEEIARADEERILSRTNSEMTSIMSSRRRSAMAHLKKAAQATKADRVLSHVVGRDASGDPEEQSPYRDDLAKVVKPRATSRPVSRPVSRSPKVEAEWEGKPADSDAAMMAEAAGSFEVADAFEADEPRMVSRDRSIFEAERQQHLPADLTEDEFSSDDILVTSAHVEDDLSEDEIDEDFEEDDDGPRGPASWSKPLFENTADDDDALAVAIATRRASRVRTALVDQVEEEDDFEEEDESLDIDEPQAADWGLGGAADAQAEDADEEGSGLADDTDFADDDDNEFADDDEDEDEDDGDWSAASLHAGPASEAPKSRGIDLDAVRSRVSQMRSDEAQAAVATPVVAEVKAEAPEVTPDAPVANDEPEPIVQVPTPAVGRAGRSAGRVKTRLLGFQAHEPDQDVFDKAGAAHSDGRTQFPVGWIVVVDGPGRGTAFTLKGGVMQIGRGAGQGVQLDFGDTAISRENHAAIAFDDETGKFFLGHGGKSNLVRLNGAPVLSTEELTHRDRIRIGETTLMLVELCNEDFIWTSSEGADDNA